MGPTLVFIAAPTPVERAGLSAMLAGSQDLRVVGETGSFAGEFRLDLSEADVLVVASEEMLDDALAYLGDGITQALVLLSEESEPVRRLRESPLSGWGVVSPDSLPEELAAAVVAAGRGLVVLPHSFTEEGLSVLEDPAPDYAADGVLTPREHQVLELISIGLPNKTIARRLKISEHTVKFHISSIYAKLGVHSRAQAVSLGVRTGLLKL